MMIHLISSGEAGGKLEEMLGRAAGGQEREKDGEKQHAECVVKLEIV